MMVNNVCAYQMPQLQQITVLMTFKGTCGLMLDKCYVDLSNGDKEITRMQDVEIQQLVV